MLKKRLIELAIVAGLLFCTSVVLWFTNGDNHISSAVLGPEKISPIGTKFWPAGSEFPWNILYDWAPVPAIMLVAAALILLVAGFGIIGVLSIQWLQQYWWGSGQWINNRPIFYIGILLSIIGVQFMSMGLLGELITSSLHREDPVIREDN